MDSALADMGCKLITIAVPTDNAMDAMLDDEDHSRSSAATLQVGVPRCRRCWVAEDRQTDKEAEDRLETGVETRGISIFHRPI